MTALDKARQLLKSAGFEHEGEDNYTARGDGNGTDCELDPALVAAARSLRKEIKALGLGVAIDTCDEWITISIREAA